MSKRTILPGQLRLVLALTSAYVVAWMIYYSQTPAGQYPVEEARATIDSALKISQGVPTDDSGHSLYTYTLALFAQLFPTSESLTKAARILNTLALAAATGFCALAAGHYWRRNRALWISGLLVGLNPVLVFWAGEVSPSLLATAFMSIALWQILRWFRRPKERGSLRAGLYLTLAAAFETTLLPLALLWPILAYLYPQSRRMRHLALSIVPIAVIGALFIVSKAQWQDPFSWHFDQLVGGTYQALGSQETFDGKNFSFYHRLHLILLLNPIHWGALFILAGAGIYVRVKNELSKDEVIMASVALSVFAISFALNGSGSQARASMIPLLAIFASGSCLLPKIWRRAGRSTRRNIKLVGLALALFSYAGYLGQSQTKSWERDYTYLAEANMRLGNSDQAVTWAEKALELNPNHREMEKTFVLAQFNDWSLGDTPRTLASETAQTYLEAARKFEGTATTHTIEAIYQYKLRDIEAAQAIWRKERDESALALLCLYWTGEITELSSQEIENYADAPYFNLLREAMGIDRNALAYGSIEKRLDNILAFTY